MRENLKGWFNTLAFDLTFFFFLCLFSFFLYMLDLLGWVRKKGSSVLFSLFLALTTFPHSLNLPFDSMHLIPGRWQ